MRVSSLVTLMEETGTGSSFAPGNGEQYATNFAFAKKLKKRIREGVSFTPEKREEYYEKASKEYDKNKSDVDRYINIFKAFTIEDMLTDNSKAKKIIATGGALDKKFSKMSDDLEEMGMDYSDEDMEEQSDKFNELHNKYYALREACYAIYYALEMIVDQLEKVTDKLK